MPRETSLACITPIARTHALSFGSYADLRTSVRVQCARLIARGPAIALFAGRISRDTRIFGERFDGSPVDFGNSPPVAHLFSRIIA